MTVFDVTLAELQRLDVVDTVDAQVALVLAEQLDSPRAGMAVSGDARELRAVMQAIRDGRPAEKGDPIVDLNARRAARGTNSQAG